MTNLKSLLIQFQNQELNFSELVEEAETLDWAVKKTDGVEEWWSNENTSSVIDLFFHEGVLTKEQRETLLYLRL